MGIDQIVIMGFTLVVILFLFVFAVDFISPLYAKLQFDSICRNYVMVIEAEDGLSKESSEAFTEAIQKLNLNNITVQCSEPTQIKKGHFMELYVRAGYETNIFSGFLEREPIRYEFEFKQNVISNQALN